ncbi:MAG: transposase, partial [Gemmataceae bacterium]|nr:transposase [Gemmataceae bacterium]
PFGGPAQVLKYLARYTHRVAIANSRLVGLDADTVSFRWKDYADGNRPKVMTLGGVEFVRRFVQHVLPAGFVRIRHFGFLANRCRDEKLTRCRTLLPERVTARGAEEAAPAPSPPVAPSEPVHRCPRCRAGRMVVIEVWADRPAGQPDPAVTGWDTS